MKVLIIALALLQLLTPFASADDALTHIGTIPLPDVSGRFDHLAIDIKGKRLFVAALGNNTLEVLDFSKSERITTISDVKRPTAAIFIPEKNQIGIASSANGCFKIYSGADYKSVATIKGLDDADNVRLDLDKNTVVIGYTDGALAFINAKNWQKTGNIKLEGHPESFQLAGQSGRIYINVPTRSEVSIIDRDQKRVTGSIPMTNYKANFPMALDESNERLFIGCRTPPRLVAFDAKNGNPLGNSKYPRTLMTSSTTRSDIAYTSPAAKEQSTSSTLPLDNDWSEFKESPHARGHGPPSIHQISIHSSWLSPITPDTPPKSKSTNRIKSVPLRPYGLESLSRHERPPLVFNAGWSTNAQIDPLGLWQLQDT